MRESHPTSVNHHSGGGRPQYVPIRISNERNGALRRDVIDLELTLTAVPGAAWIEAFEDNTQLREQSRMSVGTPRIQDNKIGVSIHERDLMHAWRYVNACVDHANDVSRRRFFEQTDELSRLAK